MKSSMILKSRKTGKEISKQNRIHKRDTVVLSEGLISATEYPINFYNFGQQLLSGEGTRNSATNTNA
jgi:hypothetical protein